jgi:hypothetical protein
MFACASFALARVEFAQVPTLTLPPFFGNENMKSRCIPVPAVAATVILCFACCALAADKPAHYLFTNNDPPGKISNSSNFYTVGLGGLLTSKATVTTGFGGIGGGYFGQNKVRALRKGKEQCVYVADSFSGQVAGVVVQTLTAAGAFGGSDNDSGASNWRRPGP